MPQRIDGVKKLTDALKTMIGLEREAYDITAAPTATDNAMSSFVKSLQGSSVQVVAQCNDDDE